MKVTKNQLRRIIREEKQKLIAENRIRKVVRAALLNENWWMDNRVNGEDPPTFPESANSDYKYEARKTWSADFGDEGKHGSHVAAGHKGLIAQYIRMQLEDINRAGLKPEEIEQLESLISNPDTGQEDIPYFYPAIIDRLPDFHDPASQEKLRPEAEKVRKASAEARAKRKAEREEEERKWREEAAKKASNRKFKKSAKAYDKYLNSIADMQKNMDAVDEMSKHVGAIAKSGGSVGEMAEAFIEEILEPAINYNDDDINGLLGQLDAEIKDAIMKKFNPSIASM